VTYHSLDCWELTSGFDSDADRRRYCTSLVTTAVELACEAIAD